MDIIDDMLEDGFCVYWAYTGVDSNGNPTYIAPVEINCRWEDTNELFQGPVTQEVSNAKVYVGIDLTVEGALRKGKLAEVTDQVNPFLNTKTYRIRRFDKMPATIDQSEGIFLRYAFV